MKQQEAMPKACGGSNVPILVDGASALRSAACDSTLSSDRSIRAHLHSQLARFVAAESDVLLIDEFTVCSGIARVDVALLNGAIHGFEIKSEADTLKRLGTQAIYFSEVMDYMTLVIVEQFLDSSKTRVPSWWGISIVRRAGKDVMFETLRDPQHNPAVNIMSFLELLRRDEAYAIAEKAGLAKGLKSATKTKLCSILAEAVEWRSLHDAVLSHLKLRVSLSRVELRTSRVDSCQPLPTS